MASTALSRCVLILCIPLYAAAAHPASSQDSDKTPPTVSSPRFETQDTRAVVFYFIASDCPISNRMLPEMFRIKREFAAQHVRFWFVYPNTTETPTTIRAHGAAYGIPANTLTDSDRQLARFTGANVTPEAAVLIPQGKSLKSVYTGRIDDRYLSLGTERPAATHHDLEAAIAAVLANHPIPPPGGPPVGCAFMTLATK